MELAISSPISEARITPPATSASQAEGHAFTVCEGASGFRVLVGGLFAVARFLLEADRGVFVESWRRFDGWKVQGLAES